MKYIYFQWIRLLKNKIAAELRHDRNVIYIHSDIAIENMQITIRDKYKDIIYTNQLTILQSQNYSFSFNSPGEKEFTIELSYKDINLQGHFTID